MRKNNTQVYSAHVKIRNFLEDLNVDGRIILNSIFKKAVGHCGVDSCFRQGSVVCSCEISGLSEWQVHYHGLYSIQLHRPWIRLGIYCFNNTTIYTMFISALWLLHTNPHEQETVTPCTGEGTPSMQQLEKDVVFHIQYSQIFQYTNLWDSFSVTSLHYRTSLFGLGLEESILLQPCFLLLTMRWCTLFISRISFISSLSCSCKKRPYWSATNLQL